MIINKEDDGTLKGIDNEVFFFSFEKFRDEICKGGYCFVCGARPNRDFNQEHVFPQWLIKKTAIHKQHLKLPNSSKLKYSTYTIPCCKNCNALLGETYEKHVSEAFTKGFESLADYISNNEGKSRLCAWLSLIFLKIHLRDFKNNISLDMRSKDGTIGDTYDLDVLHHVHAVARAMVAGVEIDTNVFGSLHIIKSAPQSTQLFDYYDTLTGRAMLIRVNDIVIIYVLDDCGAVNGNRGFMDKVLKSLPDQLSQIQLRELVAHYATANIHIKYRPIFKTNCYQFRNPNISVDLPKCEFLEYDPLVFGDILAHALKDYQDNIKIDELSGKEALDKIKSGHVIFLRHS